MVEFLDDTNFDTEIANLNTPIIVEFQSLDYCQPCKTMAPIIDEIAEDYIGRVRVVKIEAEDADNLTARYSIRSIPTVLFINNGVVVDQTVGLQTKTKLIDKLDKMLLDS